MPLKKYYCSPTKCRWMTEVEKERFYPDFKECTDMSDIEFFKFVLMNEPTINQCQGCQAGWMTDKAMYGTLHIVDGGHDGEKVACTANIYIKPYINQYKKEIDNETK